MALALYLDRKKKILKLLRRLVIIQHFSWLQLIRTPLPAGTGRLHPEWFLLQVSRKAFFFQ